MWQRAIKLKSDQKRRDERKKGNAFQSKDVISVVGLLVGFIHLSKLGSFIVAQKKELYLSQMIKIESLHELTIQTCTSMLVEGVKVFYISVTPILIILALVGILMTGVQTRFLISGDLLKFKFSRINIIQGFKRMLSLRSIVQLVKSLLKIAIIIWIIYSDVQELLLVTPDILNTSLDSNLAFLLDRTMAMVYKICILFEDGP